MGIQEAHDPQILDHYEGLIFKTAQMYAPFVDEDIEDIQQILRIKVYKALLAYDPRAPRALERDRYVFSCMKNQAKDLLKRRKRQESFIEDLAPAADDGRRMSRSKFEERTGQLLEHHEVYGLIEEDDVLVPNTLSDLERRIVCLLYSDYRQSEVARQLGLAKRDMERAMRSIRGKMADWSPGGGEVVVLTDRLAVAA